MGISLVSSVRFNHQQLPPVWRDVVFGYREMSPSEVAQYGRLSGHHRTGTEFTTFTAEPARSVISCLALTFNYFSSQVSASAHQTIRGRRGRADLQEDQRPPGTVRLRRHRELHRSRSQPASGGHQCTSTQGSGEARRGGGESQVRLMLSGDESEGPLAEDLSAG